MMSHKLGIWIAAILVAGLALYCGAVIAANYGINVIL
jgi:hypothetical protein